MVARNVNEAIVVPMVGSARVYIQWKSGSHFCVGAFGRNLSSVPMKGFSCLIYFIQKFYKFCTFKAMCKDNDAINCITL
jgi:hypothetical protein